MTRRLAGVALVLMACASSARAAGWTSSDGSVAVGRATRVAAGETMQHDLLEIGDDVVIDGDLVGDLVAVRGDVVVRGSVHGDVVVLGGALRIEQHGTVDGDAATFLGRLDAEGRVTGQTRASMDVGGTGRATYLGTLLRPEIVALRLGLLALWTLLALAAAFAAPAALVRASAALRGRFGGLTLIGLLFHASVLLLAVVFVALVVVFVGIPLLALLAIGLTLFRAAALGAVFHHVGERLLERRGAGRAASGYASVLLGALVVGALSLVPFLGELAWIVANCAGAGALLATWKRRRGG